MIDKFDYEKEVPDKFKLPLTETAEVQKLSRLYIGATTDKARKDVVEAVKWQQEKERYNSQHN